MVDIYKKIPLNMKKLVEENLEDHLNEMTSKAQQAVQDAAAKKISDELAEKRKAKEEKEKKESVNEMMGVSEDLVWDNAIESSYQWESTGNQDSHLTAISIASSLLGKNKESIEIALDASVDDDGEQIQEQDAEDIIGEDWHERITDTQNFQINEDGELWHPSMSSWSQSIEISVSLYLDVGMVIEHSEGTIWALYR